MKFTATKIGDPGSGINISDPQTAYIGTGTVRYSLYFNLTMRWKQIKQEGICVYKRFSALNLPRWRFLSGAPLQTDEESSLHEEEESLLVEGERLHRGQGNYLGKWERLRRRQCCGSGMFIPDPDFYPSRIRISDPGSQKAKTATKEWAEKN